MNLKTLLLVWALVACMYSAPTQIAQDFTGNDFTNAQGWTVVNAPAEVTDCSGTKMFGGFGKFGAGATATKVFELPPHHTIYLKLQFWKIDSWDNEEFYLWVDDQLVYKRAFAYNEGQSQKCGQGGDWRELVVDLNLEIGHSGTSAVIVMTSNLNEKAENESWAFRDFVLSVEGCPAGCAACAKGEAEASCQVWQGVSSSWRGLTQASITADGWNLVEANPQASTCGGIPLFGGFNIFGKGTKVSRQLNLPPHYRLKFKFLFAKIDSWDNESAFLKVDNNQVWTRKFVHTEGYFSQLCGQQGDWREIFVRGEADTAHAGATALVEWSTSLDEGKENESFGLRDFHIYIAKCATSCAKCTGPNISECQECAAGYSIQGGQCVAAANFILLEQSFLENTFTDISGWTLSGNKGGAKVSVCGGKSMVGGFDIFGAKAAAEKTFNLPPHLRLKISMTLYQIDSWDNEFMYIRLDGKDIYAQQWHYNQATQNLCGAGWNDRIHAIELIASHTANTATLSLTSTLNQDANDESWGFRDFKIFFEPLQACAVCYSECGFKGASFLLCSVSPNLPQQMAFTHIKSIRIPPQGRVTLFEKSDFKGKKVVYTEDQSCLKDAHTLFAQMGSADVQGEWVEVSETTLTGQ